MDALTKKEARQWCQAQGASFSESGFPTPKSRAVKFTIPPDSGQRIALVAIHLEPFEAAGKTLVWFDDWAVWPSGQRMHIFDRILLSYGESRPLMERPAFLFGEGEFEDMVSFATIGVLFLWDVYVLSANARQLVFYSHDEHGWKA